jgi:hypothetical protein
MSSDQPRANFKSNKLHGAGYWVLNEVWNET